MQIFFSSCSNISRRSKDADCRVSELSLFISSQDPFVAHKSLLSLTFQISSFSLQIFHMYAFIYVNLQYFSFFGKEMNPPSLFRHLLEGYQIYNQNITQKFPSEYNNKNAHKSLLSLTFQISSFSLQIFHMYAFIYVNLQ